jgi:hypothetical protein
MTAIDAAKVDQRDGRHTVAQPTFESEVPIPTLAKLGFEG